MPPAMLAKGPSGVWAAMAAFLLWGFSPLYYRAVGVAGAFEILAHRVVWSLLLCGALILISHRGHELTLLFKDRKLLGALLISALLVSINWLGFIWSVNNGLALEASMGYYIFPLVMVLLGALILKEPVNRNQRYALLLVAAGVVNLLWGLGRIPWIALLLATSFGLYGLTRKQIAVAPLTGLTMECLMLTPAALIYLVILGIHGNLTFGTLGVAFDLMLIASALMTAVPLLLFTYAAKRMPLSALGLLQYLNPTCQLLLAVMFFEEAFTQAHFLTFILIWGGVILYTYDGWRHPQQRVV